MKKLLLLFLVFSCTELTAQNFQLDLDAYKTFLEANKNITYSQLSNLHDAGKFAANIYNNLQVAKYTDSIETKFGLTADEKSLYDIQGRIVKTLLDKELPAGKYMTKWDGKDNFGRQAASGIYLYSLSVGEKQFIGKMNLIR